MTPIQIFISYAHADHEWLDLLRQHLGGLRNTGRIEAFDDREIMAGEEWDPEIKRKLEAADIILLIVSRHFLASKYCTTIELETAIERHQAGSVRIVGILAGPCDWESLFLRELKMLPQDQTKLKPWAKWRDEGEEDEAGTQIAKQIRKIVEEIPAKPGPGPAENPTAAPPETKPPLIAVPEPNRPHDLGIPTPDSLLLRPESGVVPFHDYRRPLIDEILSWAMTPRPRIAVRLQAGEGGTGKTRLMIEICRRLVRDQDWHAGFLSGGDGAAADLAAELACGKPCLIVMDYAETRRAEIVSLTRTALRLPSGPQIRIMLLAREGGDWWGQLADGAADDPVVAGILRSPSTKTGPYRMTRQDVPENLRAEVFTAALRALAQARGVPVPETAPPDLSVDHFGNVLLIHFAALARLRGFEAHRDLELLDAALGHERYYWERLVGNTPDAETLLPAFEQALALLTLLGGTATATDTKAILRETPGCKGQAPALHERLFDLLRRLYPQAGGVSSLQPDLLGERLVARALSRDDELLDIALARRRTPQAVKHALTTLTRLANRDPAQEPQLERALDRHLADHLALSIEVGSETGAPMPMSIAETLRSKPKAAARQIIVPLLQAIPKDTSNLADLAATIARINIDLLGDKAKKKHGGKIKAQLQEGFEEAAQRFEAIGDWTRACDARRGALEQIQSLCKTDKDNDLAQLSGAQSNLAIALRRIGRFEEALAYGREAEGGFRRLAGRRPHAYRADWAGSLTNLAAHLKDLGRFEAAIEQAQAAERNYRDLAGRQPGAYRAVWVRSLGNLADHLSDLGRFEEAIEQARAAEENYRELAERRPDAYRADWAGSLTNLANRLRDLGRFEAAIEQAQAAEENYRELAERQPDVYRADWAKSFHNLANHLRDLGRFEEALEQAQAAEENYRELAERQPDAYRADWARSLGNLATHLSDLGRFEAAIEQAQAAEENYRELAKRQPDVYRADWAWSLVVLAESRLRADDFKIAIDLCGQAIDTFQQVSPERLQALNDRIGWAHRVRAEALLGDGNPTNARTEASKAIRILRGVFEQRPDVAAEELAKATLVQARCLKALDRPGEGATLITEVLKLLLPLIERHRTRLGGVLRDLLGELREPAPHSVHTSPATEIAATLGFLE